jgi:hypothetical protein
VASDDLAKLIREIAVYQARWNNATKALVISGKVIFSKPLTAQERANLLANKLHITAGDSTPIGGDVDVKASGEWSATVTDTFDPANGSPVPCSIVVEFVGKQAWRDVRNLPPAQGCSKDY